MHWVFGGGGTLYVINCPNHWVSFQISIAVLIPGTEPRPVGTRQSSLKYTGILIKCPQDHTLPQDDIEIIIAYNGANHYLPCCKSYINVEIVIKFLMQYPLLISYMHGPNRQ